MRGGRARARASGLRRLSTLGNRVTSAAIEADSQSQTATPSARRGTRRGSGGVRFISTIKVYFYNKVVIKRLKWWGE